MSGDHILDTIKTLLWTSLFHTLVCISCFVLFFLDRVFSSDTIAYRTLNDAHLRDVTYHHKYNNSPATKSHTASQKSQGHSSEKSALHNCMCFPQLGSKIELGVLMIVGLLLLRGLQ